MKKILLFSFLLMFITAGTLNAQTGEKKGWPNSERYGFISECIKTAKKNMSEDTARFYCYCMQFKVEERYPVVDSAATLTQQDMESPEWQKEIKACLAGFWSGADRKTFLSDCINAAKSGLGEEKAKNYCECMLYKVEVKFPKSADATAAITEEAINSPEWKKIIQSCLEF